MASYSSATYAFRGRAFRVVSEGYDSKPASHTFLRIVIWQSSPASGHWQAGINCRMYVPPSDDMGTSPGGGLGGPRTRDLMKYGPRMEELQMRKCMRVNTIQGTPTEPDPPVAPNLWPIGVNGRNSNHTAVLSE